MYKSDSPDADDAGTPNHAGPSNDSLPASSTSPYGTTPLVNASEASINDGSTTGTPIPRFNIRDYLSKNEPPTASVNEAEGGETVEEQAVDSQAVDSPVMHGEPAIDGGAIDGDATDASGANLDPNSLDSRPSTDIGTDAGVGAEVGTVPILAPPFTLNTVSDDAGASIHGYLVPDGCPGTDVYSNPTASNTPSQDVETPSHLEATGDSEATTSSVTHEPTRSSTDEDVCDVARTVTKPRRLRDYRLGLETIRHFNIQVLAKVGLGYPTYDADGDRGPFRFKGTEVGQPEYHWYYGAEDRPPFYNCAVLNDEGRMTDDLYIVQSESDVWTMHDNGFAAMCLFGVDQNPEALAQYLQAWGISAVKAIYDNSLAGRRGALKLYSVFEEYGIRVDILVLEGGYGYAVSDLFAELKYDRKQFKAAIKTLPRVLPATVREWQADPTQDLPAPESIDELFPCLDETELARLPRPDCLISGMLLAGGTTLFTGTHNTGKSAIALDMSLCVSLGREWQGRLTRQGAVFFVAAEGAGGLAKRVQAWKQEYGISDTRDFYSIPQAVRLHDPTHRDYLIQMMKRRSDRPALLVIDTLSRCIGDLQEMDAVDMKTFIDAAEMICRETGAAVLIIHHNNRGSEYRGSSALPANCDGHLLLVGSPGKSTVTLKVSKIKDFADGETVTLRRQVISIKDSINDDNAPVRSGAGPETSVIFVRDDKAAAADRLSKKGSVKDGLSAKDHDALQALKAIVAGNGKGATSNEWLEGAKQAGVSKASFERAKKKLLEAGSVQCSAPGTPGARYTLPGEETHAVS